MRRDRLAHSPVRRRPGFSAAGAHGPSDPSCPARRWRDMADAVARLTDRLGLPVDPGIRGTVAALNLLGLPTTLSCEGNVNARGHGLPAPWVDFACGDDPSLHDRITALLEVFYADGIDGADDPALDPDVRLVMDGDRLSNGGGFAALDAMRQALGEGLLAPAEIAALELQLARRQAEMRRFTLFLCARLGIREAAPEALVAPPAGSRPTHLPLNVPPGHQPCPT